MAQAVVGAHDEGRQLSIRIEGGGEGYVGWEAGHGPEKVDTPNNRVSEINGVCAGKAARCISRRVHRHAVGRRVNSIVKRTHAFPGTRIDAKAAGYRSEE